jgi:NAD(P)-dependent dehydrogenase (short-subunit alcohol dehydrogenase family)
LPPIQDLESAAGPPLRRFARAVVVGASGGIGSALARLLCNEGCEVHALSRTSSKADTAASTGSIDIAQEDSVAAAAARLEAAGPFDLVFVATGLLHDASVRPEKTFRELSQSSLATYFAINAIGPALIAKHFLPLMPRRGRSLFAALSARVGSIGDNRLGGWYGYRASKAALNMLVKTLAIERARADPEAICLALHPGTVDTALSLPFQKGVPPEQLFSADDAAAKLLRVLFHATPDQSGKCLDWASKTIVP